MVDLIKPKDFTVTNEDGKECKYTLSKFDAVAGREIIAKYPTAALPKIGDYNVSEETMFKLMNYVAVDTGNGLPLRLGNRALINNHVGDWETLAKIEIAMMEYNCSFFRNGRISSFLEGFVQNTLAKILEISTRSSAPSSQAEKPASTS